VRVLVVDDQEDARDLVNSVLAGAGANVMVAGSAQEAFRLVRGWRPHVLLADIGMPVEDGYMLIRRVRSLPEAEGGLTRAVALTAYGFYMSLGGQPLFGRVSLED
jgi:CheY-like chemotaxis protein